jgi:predicted O-linked N-acetylglucosamine transferase (SPINDLY family)
LKTKQLMIQALAWQESGDLDKAAEVYRSVIRLEPGIRAAHNNLGQILLHRNRFSQAEVCFRKAIALREDDPAIYVNLGVALMRQLRYADAIAACETALRLHPDHVGALNNLAGMLKDLGRFEEAIAFYRRVGDGHDARTYSNYLLSLHYGNLLDRAAMFAEHRTWAAKFAPAADRHDRTYANTKDPGRRLRIAYLSPDFRFHPVSYFIGAILARHDRAQFDVFCFSASKGSDRMTKILQAMPVTWRDVGFLDDAALAKAIEKEKIDILVDLAGHTAENRMMTLVRKPAPVQMTYLGYPDTTGLETVDVRITDTWADPPEEGDKFATETLVRIAGGFVAYRAPADAPAVGELPALTTGFITFGSLNNLAKVSADSLKLWAQVLNAVPRSRLLLKSKLLDDPETRELLTARCANSGIDRERLLLHGGSKSVVDVMAAYGQIDVALDPTPYNGTTTTCEALWMGVPVVALAGDRHSARVGASILNAAALGRLVASTDQGYVEVALWLTESLTELAKLRHGMREHLMRSPLLDAGRLARGLEAAYRDAWRTWCEGGPTLVRDRVVRGA